MNQKKCPKCGESNPPEAVMCWACYTPLTGGGVAGAAAGGVAATTATARAKAPARPDRARSDDDDEKKAIAPWQIGAVMVALLLAGGFAFMMMSRGSSDDGEPLGGGVPLKAPGGGASSLVVPGASSSSSSSSMGITNGTVQMPQQRSDQASYRITTSPGRDVAWPSIGIMPSTGVSTTQAAALAKAAFEQIARGRNYKGAYVYVFSDRDAATAFQNFQKSRHGAPMQNSDYSTLSEVWPKTLVRYEYNNGNEDVRYPGSNPGDWWSRASNYTKAR